MFGTIFAQVLSESVLLHNWLNAFVYLWNYFMADTDSKSLPFSWKAVQQCMYTVYISTAWCENTLFTTISASHNLGSNLLLVDSLMYVWHILPCLAPQSHWFSAWMSKEHLVNVSGGWTYFLNRLDRVVHFYFQRKLFFFNYVRNKQQRQNKSWTFLIVSAFFHWMMITSCSLYSYASLVSPVIHVTSILELSEKCSKGFL